MYKFENLYLKIANDFHIEIDSILELIAPTGKKEYWWRKKNLYGKFFLIEDSLLSFNGTEINITELIKLKDILKLYKSKFKYYFKRNDLATGYYYFTKPKYFNSLIKHFEGLEKQELSIKATYISHLGYLFMIGLNLISFPVDCDLKITGKIKKGKIIIDTQSDPILPIEIKESEKFANLDITREQFNLRYLTKEDYKIKWENEQKAKDYFKEFAEKIHMENFELINKFEKCIKLCNLLINKQQTDVTHANLKEIEKIYSVLKNGYIQEPFEKFTAIFQPTYSGQKIIWLKSGPELKYFVDRLNEKLNLSNTINKWTDSRFEFKNVTSLATYLSKQTTKDEYQLLIQRLLSKNPLYNLFRE